MEGKKILWLVLVAALVLLAAVLPAAKQTENRPKIPRSGITVCD